MSNADRYKKLPRVVIDHEAGEYIHSYDDYMFFRRNKEHVFEILIKLPDGQFKTLVHTARGDKIEPMDFVQAMVVFLKFADEQEKLARLSPAPTQVRNIEV